jgi:RNA polymerase sigma-70 factor (ECF subfamily)
VLVDAELAEEVTQEVFLRLWDVPERFDPGRGKLRTFLLGETHSRAVDVVRSEDSRRRREQTDALRQAEAGYDIELEVVDLTVADVVQTAMARLPAAERRPIELAYFGGYSYREVAGLLSQPEGTVKTRIRTGLRRLRDQLDQAGFGDDG